MTDRRDPNEMPRRTEGAREDKAAWGVGGMMVALAALAVIVIFVFGYSNDRSGDPVTARSPGATTPTTTTQPTKQMPAPGTAPSVSPPPKSQ